MDHPSRGCPRQRTCLVMPVRSPRRTMEKFDAAGILNEDVEVLARGRDVEGQRHFAEAAVEAALEDSVEIDAARSCAADRGQGRRRLWLATLCGRGCSRSSGRWSSMDSGWGEAMASGRELHNEREALSAMGGIAMGLGVGGMGGGVTPVALAMMSRKAMYFGVGRPLSSSAAW